jgi:hypothetical protein
LNSGGPDPLVGPMGANIRLLGEIEFEVSTHALPAKPMQAVARFRPNPSANAVAQAIIHSLRGGSYQVSDPMSEGGGRVWFRFAMQRSDLGVSVAAQEGDRTSVVVSILLCQVQKPGRQRGDTSVDPYWPAVGDVIRATIYGLFGNAPGFTRRKDDRYDSEVSHRQQ